MGWCEHLESYSDYSNRLPRGRSYVRNGSVMDLQISPGKIEAMVMGSELYHIRINIKPLKEQRWQALKRECAGKIKSLLELLKGGVSEGVMKVMSHREDGMFPSPKEITMTCSCPDSAGMCKHLAAVLYGVGSRLDTQPELLFTLRKSDPAELVAAATISVGTTTAVRAGDLAEGELADVFGIDLVDGAEPPQSGGKPVIGVVARRPKLARAAKSVAKSRGRVKGKTSRHLRKTVRS
jgi:uncharacterized Zn finger protein